jgi:hypothetical protein
MMVQSLIQRLTDHPNPSVRYLALTGLRCPAPQPIRVQAARDSIPEVPPVRSILDAQYPAGYWMHPGLGVSPRYRATVWQVLFLAQLGVGTIDPVLRGVESLLEANCDAVGAFHLSKGNAGRSPALTGALLWAVARIGVTDDVRLARSWLWLDEEWRDWKTTDVLSSATRVWLLRAAAAWGRQDWIDRLVPGLSLEPSGVLTFPQTLQPDALARMEAWCDVRGSISDAIHLPDARSFRAALMRKLQGPAVGWPLERIPGKLWFDPGSIGTVNPWVTIRALRVLKCLRHVR